MCHESLCRVALLHLSSCLKWFRCLLIHPGVWPSYSRCQVLSSSLRLCHSETDPPRVRPTERQTPSRILPPSQFEGWVFIRHSLIPFLGCFSECLSSCRAKSFSTSPAAQFAEEEESDDSCKGTVYPRQAPKPPTSLLPIAHFIPCRTGAEAEHSVEFAGGWTSVCCGTCGCCSTQSDHRGHPPPPKRNFCRCGWSNHPEQGQLSSCHTSLLVIGLFSCHIYHLCRFSLSAAGILLCWVDQFSGEYTAQKRNIGSLCGVIDVTIYSVNVSL